VREEEFSVQSFALSLGGGEKYVHCREVLLAMVVSQAVDVTSNVFHRDFGNGQHTRAVHSLDMELAIRL